MALAGPAADRRALRFRLAGFPVRIDAGAPLLLAIFGFAEADLGRILVWVVVALAAILVHELGHAVAARAFGGAPEIDLYGFGGLTSYSIPGGLSRPKSIVVSLAGPFAGAAVALAVAWALSRAGFGGGDGRSLATYAIDTLVWVGLGWGVLNLLPILPLDGGQVVRDLLPGSSEQRERIAGYVSVVVGGTLALLAYRAGITFGALLLGMFAAMNAGTLSTKRAARVASNEREAVQDVWGPAMRGDEAALARARDLAHRSRDPGIRQAAASALALGLAGRGELARAQEEVGRLGVPLPDEVEGMLRVLQGDALGLEPIRARFRADARGADLLAWALVSMGRFDELADHVDASPPGTFPPSMLDAAARAARDAGATDASARLSRVLER